MDGVYYVARPPAEIAAVWSLMALSVLMAILMGRALDSFLPRRRAWPARLALVVLLTFAGGGPYWVGDGNSLYILPFFFGLFCLCLTGPISARLTMAAIFYSLYVSVGMMLDSAPRYVEDASILLEILPDVLKMLCWAAVWLFVRRITARGAVQLSARMWTLVGVLSLAPLFAQLAFVLGLWDWYELASETEAVVYRFTYLILPFVALSDLGLLYALTTLSRYERLEKERQTAELSRTYYTQLEERQREVRRLRHDMANHLQTLSGLCGEDRDGYLRSLLDSPALRPEKRYCENRVANAIFTAKAAEAERDGTVLEVEAALPEATAVEDTDLCTILGNALDNALEACRKLPAPQRKISVRLRADKGMLALRMENPCLEPVCRTGRRILTSKTDREHHGFGTENIQRTVEKYGGSVEFSQQDGIFRVLFYIPLNA